MRLRRQFDLGLLILRPIKNRYLPDASRHLGTTSPRQLLAERTTLRGVVVLDADLDQLMRGQRALRLLDDRRTGAAAANAHDRLERMRETFEVLPLFRCKRHTRNGNRSAGVSPAT